MGVATDETTAVAQGGAKQKSRPTKILPTDRITFPKQLDILRGIAAASGPGNKAVTNGEVAGIVDMVTTTISLANAFFSDTGLISRTDAGILPAPEVVAYGHAFEWNKETAAQKLSPVLERSWFAQALLPRLRFKPIADDEALQVLAEASGALQDKKPQLSMLLSYLSAAGVIVQEGGQVRKGKIGSQTSQAEPGIANPNGTSMNHDGPADAPSPPASPPSKPGVNTAFMSSAEGLVQFHVSVKVNMAEFAGWEPSRIQAFFSGIAQVLAAKGKIEEGAGQ